MASAYDCQPFIFFHLGVLLDIFIIAPRCHGNKTTHLCLCCELLIKIALSVQISILLNLFPVELLEVKATYFNKNY